MNVCYRAGIATKAAQRADYQCRRVLVLLPGADIRAEMDQFARLRFLKCRAETNDVTIRWDHRAMQLLARAQPNAGEIEKVG